MRMKKGEGKANASNERKQEEFFGDMRSQVTALVEAVMMGQVDQKQMNALLGVLHNIAENEDYAQERRYCVLALSLRAPSRLTRC